MQNKTKSGYKQTKVGLIPEDWDLISFCDAATIANGQVSPLETPYSDYIHIGPDNIISGSGQLIKLKYARELGLISSKYLFDQDSIVYSKIRPNLNKVCIPNFTGLCSADAYPIRPNDNTHKEFLFCYMTSQIFLQQSIAASMRTGMPKINRNDLNMIKIPLPPMREQKKIAKILTTWDEAIEKTEKLIEAKQRRKKGLMQQLLTGKTRFPGFGKPAIKNKSGKQTKAGWIPEDWECDNLGNFTDITTGSSNREDSGLAGKYTFFDRSEDVRTSDKYLFDGEVVIVAGEGQKFLPKYFVGKFDLHQRTYAIMNFQQTNGRYIYYYLWQHSNYFLAQAVGSTVKSLRLPMFQKMPISLPTLTEQKKIAAVLSACDEEIELHQKQLEQYKTQKRGLMQKLLTGTIRV